MRPASPYCRFPSWHFAKKQAQIAQDADAPLFKYAYAFTLPTDFMRLVELEDRWVFSVDRATQDTNPIPPYEMQGRSLLTDMTAPLRIGYVRDLTDEPTLWHPLFEEVVVAALAAALANPLAKSMSTVEAMLKLRRLKVTEARRVNAIQQPPKHIPDGSWMVARIY